MGVGRGGGGGGRMSLGLLTAARGVYILENKLALDTMVFLDVTITTTALLPRLAILEHRAV